MTGRLPAYHRTSRSRLPRILFQFVETCIVCSPLLTSPAAMTFNSSEFLVRVPVRVANKDKPHTMKTYLSPPPHTQTHTWCRPMYPRASIRVICPAQHQLASRRPSLTGKLDIPTGRLGKAHRRMNLSYVDRPVRVSYRATMAQTRHRRIAFQYGYAFSHRQIENAASRSYG